MHIEPIGNNYPQHAENYKAPKKRRKTHVSIAALTFDSLSISSEGNFLDQGTKWLESYVQSLPDEVVKERMKKFSESYDDLADCIIDKLIMEEL